MALGTGTNLLREVLKLASDDAEKYAVDLNSLYKKYEIAAKVEQAKNVLETEVYIFFDIILRIFFSYYYLGTS